MPNAAGFKPYFIVPPLSSMIMGALLTIGLTLKHAYIPTPSPVISSSNTVSAGFYNILVILLMALAGLIVVYLLVRYAKFKAFALFKDVMIIFLVYTLVTFYLYEYATYYDIYPLLLVVTFYPLSLGLTAALSYFSLYSNNQVLRSIGIVSYSAMAGSLLATSLPPVTAAMVPIALAIYDVFMVYKGLLGKLADSMKGGVGRSLLRGLVLDLRDTAIGVGDLVVYSLMSSFTISLAGSSMALTLTVLILGVLIGFYATYRLLLPFRGYAPALPLPVLLGFVPVILILHAI
ncbi:hypothetical protein [Caldivirga maquilingensis]|uniref:Uncharacterized protein n=1 Tax=Caldivirga maquilingensis (strain ATCC 700844 / DSM 13496 / JCM 10307 / IC-167) TaxID=397948 RepID=A8M9U6_CALMQ|nr:hypothetical protein [Caldivirga maquilingensis]ABW02417.1 hypothetical protein Cmaq_1594 [Caldivirga maquilingensis IC-167]